MSVLVRHAVPDMRAKVSPLYFAVLRFVVLIHLMATIGYAQELPSPERVAEYSVEAPKNIVELQQFRSSRTTRIEGPDGKAGTATLMSLNPSVGAWYLLGLEWDSGKSVTYHLENPEPARREIGFDDGQPGMLVILEADAQQHCRPWAGAPSEIETAAASKLPFAALCGGSIQLRNRVTGKQTELERIAGLLRDRFWGGEALINFAKDSFYADAFRDTAGQGVEAALPEVSGGAPQAARTGETYSGKSVSARNFGIGVAGASSKGLLLGRWYPVAGLDGVHAGVMLPGAVAGDILKDRRERANALDAIEASALVYLVAFDLNRFTLGWARGTGNPGVEWSPRPPASVRRRGMPGPDGFDRIDPLISTGILNPAVADRVVATFAGGFKRWHGAFRGGDLAESRGGHHYGFIEQGVVLSKLQPDLATIYVLTDGIVRMKTWGEEDDKLLAHVVHARQNGVSLVEWDAETGQPVPGARVNRWLPGNWSGSAEAQLRTARAGACLIEEGASRFLVYAYFSDATPSAMAQVFRAYGCRYAMLMDMNAPVLTYLAVYPRTKDALVVEHLVVSMNEADMSHRGKFIPRFLGFPDNRDFFYLLKREDAQ